MKSNKSKKSKKTKPNLFQKFDFKPKSIKVIVLVLVCVVVLGTTFLVGGKLLSDHWQKKERSVLGSKPKIQIIKSVIAAENQKNENTVSAENSVLPKESRNPERMFIEVIFPKDQAGGETRTKIIARQRVAETALINSAPILAGHTKKLTDGKRMCPVKSKHPQRGGKAHVDEDCCADYNEYPNPRCFYTPEEMGILKKR